MILFGLNLLLAIVWAALNGTYSLGALFAGFLIGYATLWIARPLYNHTAYFDHFRRFVAFVGFFVKAMLVASLRVAHDIVTPTSYARPGIVAIPLDAETDLEITLLASLITLTPGSLSLDVSEDRKTLYVHGMFVDDVAAFRTEIKQVLERRVLELLR